MPRFIETIRIEHGVPCNPELHEARMNKTRREFYPGCAPIVLQRLLTSPGDGERTRCRIEYGSDIQSIEYFPYTIRPVRSLKCIIDDELNYAYKAADRTALNALYDQRGEADDVLIIRRGMLTDTSICNVALWDGIRWITPASPLLKGTMREKLLREGAVSEGDIPVSALERYKSIRLFNAMIDFGEVELPVPAIGLP